MIRAFRKIRLGNLLKGKFGTYSTYALGEVALIVLGILIALQVSNYNDIKKSKLREEKYLIALKDEMTRNLQVLKNERASLSQALAAQRKLGDVLKQKSDTISETYFSFLLTTSFSPEFELDYENGIMTQLISTGGLSEIRNDSLRNIIASWQGSMVGLRKQEKELQLYRRNATQHLIENGDLNTLFFDPLLEKDKNHKLYKPNNSNKSLLNDQVFENYIQLYMTIADFLQSNFYDWLEKEITQTIEMIDRSIRK